MIGSFLELLVDLLAQVWQGIHRAHRGGLGASPRERADFRRNRWIVGVLAGLCVVAVLSLWWLSRG